MKDESLLELQEQIKKLDNKDASYVAGFKTVYLIFKTSYETAGSPIQKALLAYLTEELEDIYKVKSQHGKFKHIVK